MERATTVTYPEQLSAPADARRWASADIEGGRWSSPWTRDAVQIMLAVVAFLLLSNCWTGFASHTHPWSNDVVSYQQMAAAAPGLPKVMIGSAYSQRFAPHYVVGLLQHATGLGIHGAYRIAWALCFLGLIAVFARTLLAMRLGLSVSALAFALFVLNPYSLRESILTPGAIQDLSFVLGLGVLMWGLLDNRFKLVLVGTLIAVLSRQTELLVAPVAAYWVLRGPVWREVTPRARRMRAAAVLAVAIFSYGAMDLVSASFTKRFQPSFPRDTILALLAPSHAHISTLASHLARCAIPLLIPVAVMLTPFVAARLRGARLGRLPFEFYACLAVAAAVILQPVGVSPSFPGFAHNEQRLVGIGLLPLVLAVGRALGQAHAQGVQRRGRSSLWVALGALALGSLHHIYTVIGPPGLGAFVVLQLLAGGLAFMALLAPARLRSHSDY